MNCGCVRESERGVWCMSAIKNRMRHVPFLSSQHARRVAPLVYKAGSSCYVARPRRLHGPHLDTPRVLALVTPWARYGANIEGG
jgi:hypothetical protein